MSCIARQRRIACRLAGTSLAIIGVVVLLTGCGSSTMSTVSSQRSRWTLAQSTVSQHGRPTPGQSNADVKQEGTRSANGRIRVGHIGVQSARPTPETAKDDLTTSSPKPLNPCKLVSLPEARAITSGGVRSLVEAPLGPTCIYSEAKGEITVTIEPMTLSQASHQLSHRKAINLGSHRGYCGRLGTQTLYVPLAGRHVLHVTAPCAIAGRFAARALTRITA